MSMTTSQTTESFVWYKSMSGKIMLGGFAAILLLSVTQAFAKVPTTDITSSGTWSVAICSPSCLLVSEVSSLNEQAL